MKQHDAAGKTTLLRRAQRAKRAERLRCLSAYSSGFSGRFTETTEKNTARRRNENNKTRFPFPYLDRFMLAGFASRKASKRGRARQRRAKTHPRRPKMRQEALKTGQRRPKRPPRGAKTRPRRPKMPPEPPRTANMTKKSSQVGMKIAHKIDVNFQKRFFQKCL